MQTTAQKAAIELVHGFTGSYPRPGTVSVTADGLLIGSIDQDDVPEIKDTFALLKVADAMVYGAPLAEIATPRLADGVVFTRTFDRRTEIVVNGRQSSCTLSADGSFVTMADKYSEMVFDIEAIDETIAALTRLKTIAENFIDTSDSCDVGEGLAIYGSPGAISRVRVILAQYHASETDAVVNALPGNTGRYDARDFCTRMAVGVDRDGRHLTVTGNEDAMARFEPMNLAAHRRAQAPARVA